MKFEHWMSASRDYAGEAALRQAGISPLTAIALCGRGAHSPAEANSFLESSPDLLHDPMLLKDMDKAVQRIEAALESGETIAVYGDYDVDGITSTCLLSSYLKSRGANVIPYIPDRLSEGYSLNTDAITRLRLKGARLLISVDCGITNQKEVQFAKGIGMDVIITDHHECKEEIPNAAAVVNPHRPDCPYPFKHLAGVGVALKLVLALTPEQYRDTVLNNYVDLAAIGTVADVMSITDENRAIVTLGLATLEQSRRPGLQMLIRECGLEDKAITSTSIGFTLAPRLNAAGRMGCPLVAAELLLTNDPQQGAALAQTLCDLNRERQLIEQNIFTQCLELLEAHPELAEHAIVLADHSWHQGVVGIVASRLSERFGVPSFMICLDEENHGKGSCRSYGDFNLFHALEQCADLLDGFGGHELAAGFTISEEQIVPFRQKMQQIAAQWQATQHISSSLQVDAVLDDASLLTLDNVTDLQLLEPYGTGNAQPVFVLNGVSVLSINPVGKGRHTRLRVIAGDMPFDAILFSYTPEDTGLQAGARADLAFYPQINQFRGTRSVQLLLTDVKPSPSHAQIDRMLYQRWKQGDFLSHHDLDILLPERRDFVAVWRYLLAHAAGDRYRETPARLSRNIARSTGGREAFARTMVCLEVFQECGLVHFTEQSNQLHITIRQIDGKVNLEQSPIMIALHKMLES